MKALLVLAFVVCSFPASAQNRKAVCDADLRAAEVRIRQESLATERDLTEQFRQLKMENRILEARGIIGQAMEYRLEDARRDHAACLKLP